MKSFLIFVLLPLILFSSCGKEDYSDLAKQGEWQLLHDKTDLSIREDGISKDSLYYHSLSLYYTGEYEDAISSSRLYVTMYDPLSPAILKILLYKAPLLEAYEAGSLLLDQNVLNSSDKIQFFKLLVSLEKTEEASVILMELKEGLSLYDYCFAMINGGASSDDIFNGMRELYEREGVSKNFLAVADKAFIIFSNRQYFTVDLENFILGSSNGNPQYGLIIGDYHLALGNKDMAVKYWNYAEDTYPNAYETRMGYL